MPLIEEFLDHYNREFDHYSQAASLVQRRIETLLAKRGILAIVTSRAKGNRKLATKLHKRNAKTQYVSIASIYRDIIDLAGVRVAIYFPGDKDSVDALIKESFDEVRKPKTFPERKMPKPGKRFMGYVATHYLVKIRSEGADTSELRYTDTTVEVQVASVLMHAWAEVEHDLEYKPETGTLSEDESAILDEINGLVLSGELALERLQRAVQRRTSKQDIPFADQFELASVLSQRASKDGWQIKDVGRVDVLLTALRHLKQATPSGMSRYLNRLTDADKEFPIADSVIDQLLAGNQRGVKELSEILGGSISATSPSSHKNASESSEIGSFLLQWRQVEMLLSKLAGGAPGRIISPLFALNKIALSEGLRKEVDRTRVLRNELVHGSNNPNIRLVKEATDFLQKKVIPELRENLRSVSVPIHPISVKRRRKSIKVNRTSSE